MALPEPIPRREIILDVTSSTIDYEIPFPFIFDMDIEIAVSTAALPNTFSRLTYPTGYTLTGAGAPFGGAVHLAAAPEVGAKIRVRGISAENVSEEVVRGVRYNFASIENVILRVSWGLQESRRDLAQLGDIVMGVQTHADEVLGRAETLNAASAENVNAARLYADAADESASLSSEHANAAGISAAEASNQAAAAHSSAESTAVALLALSGALTNLAGAFSVDANGHLLVTYAETEISEIKVDAISGHLIITYGAVA